MTVLSHVCPHCRNGVAFTLVHSRHDPDGSRWISLACPTCHGGGLAKVGGSFPGGEPAHIQGDLRTAQNFSLTSFSPAVAPISGPDHLPVAVLSAYLEAMHNLDGKRWNSAGMMFRRSIELATKILLPNVRGDLRTRIDKLAETNCLTSSMQEWAHHIRLEGNAAAHDLEEISETDAQSLQAFAELFLLYQFTLPEMLKEKRAEKAA